MPIDSCAHSYAELSKTIFPGYMKTLRGKLKRPVQMDVFSQPGLGVATILTKLKLDKDFPGCYVLLCDEKPFYVGISRSVVQRLRNHAYGQTHFAATLAYRMTAAVTGRKMTQAQAMRDQAFREIFDAFRGALSRCEVAHIAIENPLERYLFEVYCAMQLNCCNWNTFESH